MRNNKKTAKIKQKESPPLNYKKLVDKYKLLTYLMDHIPDVIYFKDKKGKLILVNQAHAKGLGLTPRQVVGKTDFDLFPKKRAEMMARDDAYVFRTGRPIIDKIERATNPDGTDNYVSTTKIPKYDDKGKIVGLIGLTRDVTRRMQFDRLRQKNVRIEKRLEMLEELNKIKSEFVSSVSHELRTPLSIVKQLVTLVYEEITGRINSKQREALKRAQDNIERLRKIIDELLDISRIESGRFKLHYSLVNLKDLIANSSDFFIGLAQEKGIGLHYKLPKKEVNLFIDADRINQVLSNLIDNAIKFTEQGGEIKVEVKVFETKVRIGVIDTGIGIAKANLDVLFQKFEQVSKLKDAEKKGVGLGLALTKELVERHRGEIWVESRLGVGSKFYFTLPRFYAPDLLNSNIKGRINDLLKKGISLCIVELLIVNYQEFKKRIKIGSKKLFKDLEEIIKEAFKKFVILSKEKPQIALTDIRNGKCSIIFPEATEKRATRLANSIRSKIKVYFIKNKIEDVFITLGILSYPRRDADRTVRHLPVDIYLKRIHVGSEMRHSRRILYRANIKFIFKKDKAESAHVVDVSKGGISFVSKRSLKTDSLIKIKLSLPKTKEAVDVKARVAWIKKLEQAPRQTFNKYHVGLEFVKLKSKEKRILSGELKEY